MWNYLLHMLLNKLKKTKFVFGTLTHFTPMFRFYTLWKRQKTTGIRTKSIEVVKSRKSNVKHSHWQVFSLFEKVECRNWCFNHFCILSPDQTWCKNFFSTRLHITRKNSTHPFQCFHLFQYFLVICVTWCKYAGKFWNKWKQWLEMGWWKPKRPSQQAIICSKFTIEIIEQRVKYVQS